MARDGAMDGLRCGRELWTGVRGLSIMRAMTGTLHALAAAVAFFVGSHILLASLPVRTPLIKAVGEGVFRIGYSTVVGAGLVWTLLAYGDAPYLHLWFTPPALYYLPHVLMLPACILVAAGLSTKSATAIGGDRVSAEDPRPVVGITTVTRHPFLTGVLLWAIAHAAVNGDAASLILFGGMALLCIFGMLHIDSRRRATMGSAWGPIALGSSAIPFLAAIQGRAKVDWAGIGLWRLALGIGIYIVLAYGHGFIAGVPLTG